MNKTNQRASSRIRIKEIQKRDLAGVSGGSTKTKSCPGFCDHLIVVESSLASLTLIYIPGDKTELAR